MKKMLVLAGAILLVSSLASASNLESVNELCTAVLFSWNTQTAPAGPAEGTVSCPGISLSGADSLQSVEVYFLADYTGGGLSTTNIIDTYETPGGAGSWGAPNQTGTYECITTGTTSSGSNEACDGSGNTAPNYETQSGFAPGTTSFAAFGVNVTAYLTQGTVTGSSANAIVEFDYLTPAPEPASLLMMGGGVGLLGLAQFAGKFLKKKKS